MCACERQQEIAAEEGKELPGPTIISRIKSRQKVTINELQSLVVFFFNFASSVIVSGRLFTPFD